MLARRVPALNPCPLNEDEGAATLTSAMKRSLNPKSQTLNRVQRPGECLQQLSRCGATRSRVRRCIEAWRKWAVGGGAGWWWTRP